MNQLLERLLSCMHHLTYNLTGVVLRILMIVTTNIISVITLVILKRMEVRMMHRLYGFSHDKSVRQMTSSLVYGHKKCFLALGVS